MTPMIINIPLEPVSKKNSQRLLFNSKKAGGFYKRIGATWRYAGVPFIAPSVKFEQYQKAAMRYLPRINKPIDTPVEITVHFYRGSRRRCDLTNLLEAIDDILVHGRILADDSFDIIASHDGSRIRYDKENPRTVVFINPYNQSETWKTPADPDPEPEDNSQMRIEEFEEETAPWEGLDRRT